MSKAPEALVLTGYGINCDYETLEACTLAGFSARRVHLNDLIGESGMLFRQKLVVFPGGFSYGDDLGSGVAFASKIRYAAAGEKGRLIDLFGEYVSKGGLVLGICNGFQILVRMGLIPALDGIYGNQEVTLAPNKEGYFIDRWVRLLAAKDSPCVFTRGLEVLSLPVRHGEGRFLARDAAAMAGIERQGLVALRYCSRSGGRTGAEVSPTMDFPSNPNGSDAAVAGLCDPSGRVFGLMPHPEAAIRFHQYPDWTRRGEEARRAGVRLPEEGEGLAIFRNAFAYVG
jgi:phosphoribosylformylglycinamidine (FGAM) synthase-like amidotransferase family enzyme